MPIRPNPANGDPYIAQAMDNLAKAFAPLSGSDVAGYANAKATREEAARLADAWRIMNDPNATWDQRDRAAAGAKLYAPSQSRYAVDQDIVARHFAAERAAKAAEYGSDRTYAASTENNVRDNARALQTNAADNDRAVATNRLDNQRQAVTSLYQPLNPGQVAPAVPVEMMTAMGLPGIGERRGAEPILSKDQAEAQAFRTLPPEQQRAVAFGNTPIDPVLDHFTGKPIYATRPDAIGRQPAADFTKQGEAAGKIRGEIAQLPSYKNYAQAAPVYRSMMETADRDTKASDLNLIYGLAKILDPGSVVRESEIVMAQDTQGTADRLNGMVNAVIGGSRLMPEARVALMREAQSRMAAYEDIYGADLDRYGGIVDRAGLSRADVLPQLERSKPFELPQNPDAAKSAAPAAAASTAAPVKVATPAEAMKLAPGTPIELPDGSQGVVPPPAKAQPAPRAAGASGGW
ncbi:hypothetical protein IHQ68_03375 [Chelatococcus sambhunathii]|uniref:Uncharacterized protein n=1 Tax=Chelatococcus sambhunathii TaxID=363953 RepID=A0ABU1DC29_9HYPH|nr:hypothetical protein [Chelatococcus sambhunathii]MDR4305663.1 hypothetical protein [Chelatococcus sambhunathii]